MGLKIDVDLDYNTVDKIVYEALKDAYYSEKDWGEKRLIDSLGYVIAYYSDTGKFEEYELE